MRSSSSSAAVPRHLPWQIGDWLADPATNELRREGTTVRIEPKAMDVLAALAAQAGAVIARDALLAAAWPGVVVGDEALTQAVIKLRRALGDDPRAPRYIETIAKRGYRLVAPTRVVAPSPTAAAGPAATDRATVGRTPTDAFATAGSTPTDDPATAGSTPTDAFATAGSTPTDDPAAPVARAPGRRHGRPRRWAAVAAAALAGVVALALLAAAPAPDASASREATGSADARTAALTVAVLPFEALGEAPDQAYLARGISEDLVTDLSRFSGLRVVRGEAREGGAGDDAPRYRVSGSVQREAGTLRVNVQLVDARTGEALWAGRIERPWRELFAVQNELTAALVDLLPAKVNELERQRVARRYTTNLAAYDDFLRGEALFLVRGEAPNVQARAYFRHAIEQDPTFARAYAALALTYALEPRLDPAHADPAALERALHYAQTARAIDPTIPDVHWAEGFVHAQARRHDEAIAALTRAIALDPSFADAYALLGGVYTYVGRPAASIPLLRTALRLNPNGGYLYFLLLGRAYLFEGDVEQALLNLRAAANRNPADVETHAYLAAALAAAGQPAGARWEADEIRALLPGFSARSWLAAYPMSDARQAERLAALMARAGL